MAARNCHVRIRQYNVDPIGRGCHAIGIGLAAVGPVSSEVQPILGQCAADQSHPRSVGLVQCSRHLEDPDSVRATRELDIR